MYRYRLAPVDHPTNGDEERYPDYRVSFGKTLPHNDLGEVDSAAFRALLAEVRRLVAGSVARREAER